MWPGNSVFRYSCSFWWKYIPPENHRKMQKTNKTNNIWMKVARRWEWDTILLKQFYCQGRHLHSCQLHCSIQPNKNIQAPEDEHGFEYILDSENSNNDIHCLNTTKKLLEEICYTISFIGFQLIQACRSLEQTAAIIASTEDALTHKKMQLK